jgi:hypothetical protein
MWTEKGGEQESESDKKVMESKAREREALHCTQI